VNELITLVRQVLTVASGRWIPDRPHPTPTEKEAIAIRSNAELGNGVRWSDVVAAIESERVQPSRERSL